MFFTGFTFRLNNNWLRFGLFLLHPLQVFLPFHRKGVLLLTIALFTGRDNIIFCWFSTPYHGDYMVHSHIPGQRHAFAVITYPLCTLLFPPLSLTEISRLLFFSPDLLIGNCRNKVIHFVLASILMLRRQDHMNQNFQEKSEMVHRGKESKVFSRIPLHSSLFYGPCENHYR